MSDQNGQETTCRKTKVQGRVKFFERQKGTGFIVRPELPGILRPGEGDVFVHHQNIVGSGRKNLFEGDLVEYDLHIRTAGPHKGKLLAKNVRVVEEEVVA